MKVAEAREALMPKRPRRLVDMDAVRELARRARRADTGIVFIDEIDKVAVGRAAAQGADVSREGVQRDLLPIVEGSTVQTKHGPVRTDHILFIAAGAFHVAKPSDLIPELQGRFPIRVELSSLSQEDFVRILTEPRELPRAAVHGAARAPRASSSSFEDDGIDAIADVAARVNERTDDIGARRLHTVMEKLLEELTFDAPDLGRTRARRGRGLRAGAARGPGSDEDLSRFIL